MGTIASVATGSRHTLAARTLIGRAAISQLCLSSDAVSAEHAVLFREADGWFVRDLGSTNGTWLDGERLVVGQKTRVPAGAELCFGGSDRSNAWRVLDTERSGPRARCIDTGETRMAVQGLLQLPNVEDVAMTVFHDDARARWIGETESSSQEVVDQSVVQVGDASFLLELPPVVPHTSATEPLSAVATPTLEAAELRFNVSRDEEHVDLTLRAGGAEIDFPARSFHYMLVTLARKRIQEHTLPPAERGWMRVEDLLEQLRVTRQKLNLDISRARRQFAEAGVLQAVRLVERRPQSAQLRLGVANIAVGP